MARVMWLLNRCSAALSGAFAVGVLVGAAFGVFGALTSLPACVATKGDAHGHEICAQYATTFAQLFQYFLVYVSFNVGWAAIFSGVLGVIPGTIALTVTPARKHPWRALVTLVPATVVGFFAALGIGYIVPHANEAGTLQYYVWLSAFIVVPSLAGFLVAINFNKLPRRLVGA
jgi:hypothetical protein